MNYIVKLSIFLAIFMASASVLAVETIAKSLSDFGSEKGRVILERPEIKEGSYIYLSKIDLDFVQGDQLYLNQAYGFETILTVVAFGGGQPAKMHLVRLSESADFLLSIAHLRDSGYTTLHMDADRPYFVALADRGNLMTDIEVKEDFVPWHQHDTSELVNHKAEGSCGGFWTLFNDTHSVRDSGSASTVMYNRFANVRIKWRAHLPTARAMGRYMAETVTYGGVCDGGQGLWLLKTFELGNIKYTCPYMATSSCPGQPSVDWSVSVSIY